MKEGIVNSSFILSTLRLNSKYHLSDAVIFENMIKARTFKFLGDLSFEIFTSGRVKRIYTEKENGFPYLGNNEIRSISPLMGCKHISKRFFNEGKSFIKEGMILTGRVGQDTVGNYNYASKSLESCIASDNVIRIVGNDIMKAGYIFSFLASKYGFSLTRRYISGAAQPFITEEMLSQIPVPVLSEQIQKKSNDLIITSNELKDKANILLSQSEQEWVELLKIEADVLKKLTNPLERNFENCFLVKPAKFELTFRARNYSPRKTEIIRLLSRNKFNPLKELIKKPLERGERFLRVSVSENSENSVELLNQGDIFDFHPKGKTISKKAIKNWQEEITHKNLILIPALGTLGESEIFSRAKFCYGYLEGKTVAEGLLRIVPNEEQVDPAYLYLVLSSNLWFRLLRNSVCGTNLLGYILPMVNEYPIPRLSKLDEGRLGDNIRKAHEFLNQAITMEANAIELIEKEIESWRK